MNNSISPNEYGKKSVVESYQKVEINSLVRRVKDNIKKELLSLEIAAMGSDIQLVTSKTRWGGLRFWFQCPQCTGRVGTLFHDPMQKLIACRKCLNLDWKSHRYNKMAELSTLK